MKKIILTMMSAILCLMCACTANEDIVQNEIILGKVVQIYDSSMLVAGIDDKHNELYGISTENIVLSEDISEGSVVEIHYSGYTREIYPASPDSVTKIELVENQTDLVGLYVDLFHDIYRINDDNPDHDTVSVDLSEVSNLTQTEKMAVEYILLNDLYKENIFVNSRTYDELVEDGFIDENDRRAYYDKLILIKFTTNDTDTGEFTFDVSKKFGFDNEYGYSDSSARLHNGNYLYDLGEKC